MAGGEMLKSNWRGHIALVGIAAAALFCISLILYLPQSPYRIERQLKRPSVNHEYPKDEDAALEARIWLRKILEHSRPNAVLQSNGKSEVNSEQFTTALDLDAQWSTAISTADMVDLTRLQMLVGFLGLLGLGATVIYAKRAAAAAEEAARYAQDQAQIIRSEFNATHRARVGLRFVEHVSIGADIPITGTFFLGNAGDAEATVKAVVFDVFWRDKNQPGLHNGINLIPKQSKFFPIQIPPGKEAHTKFTARAPNAHEILCVQNGTHEFCLIGAIQYTDASKIDRATSFFRIYTPQAGTFMRVGNTDPHAERDYED